MSRFLLCAIVILFLLSSVKGQRVVIVGAGVSGLSAAKRLCDFNLCNITILEALDRIGGRLFTDDYHGHKLEMGAQYIQCVEENPVYQFLSKHEDLSEYVNQTTEGRAKLNAAYISGKTTTANITELLRNSFGLRTALNDYVRHKLDKEKMPEITLQNVSIFDVVNSIWRNEYEQDNNADEVLNVFLNAEDTLNAANTWVTGVLLYQYYKMFDAPGVRLHSGYSILLNHLQRYLPESSIKLKKSVGLINWNNGEKQATPVVVEVSAADGTRETLPADYVIFTPSLGYLKYAQDFIFAPGLPQNKKNALKTIGFGTVNKLFLYYENKFWDQGDFPLYILWDNSTADDDFADPPNHWIKYVYIFYEYDDSNLLIWLNETASLLISDRSKWEVSSAITQLLRRLLADNSIPAPDDVIVTHWEQEANFRGSYSFTSVGESGKMRNILSDPLSVNGIPRVLFAGEATHSSRFATIDGAFASGIREADRIIALHNSGLCTTCNSSVIVIAMMGLFLIQYMEQVLPLKF